MKDNEDCEKKRLKGLKFEKHEVEDQEDRQRRKDPKRGRVLKKDMGRGLPENHHALEAVAECNCVTEQLERKSL